MSDDRPRAPHGGKPLDLEQLTAEVGAPLAMSSTDVVVVDAAADVTATQLLDAVQAHSAPPRVAFTDAISAASTLEQLKDALLGVVGPGAAPRRS